MPNFNASFDIPIKETKILHAHHFHVLKFTI
jgi:hypothetical protein